MSSLQKYFSNEVNSLAKKCANEFSNRNLAPLLYFIRFSESNIQSELRDLCKQLLDSMRIIVNDKTSYESILNIKEDGWLAHAIDFSSKDGVINKDDFTYQLCIAIIAVNSRNIDEDISNLNDVSLLDNIGIKYDKNHLVDLTASNIELKRSGLIVDAKHTLYLHQFMRRMYSANFVGIPHLLKHFMDEGNKVYARLDPLRVTEARHYRDGPIEADYWHGKPFSNNILDDKNFHGRTVHRTSGYYNFSYDVRYTVFRTKMMDTNKNLREFVIEEYCKPTDTLGGNSSGFGKSHCIQKFAHFVYDQNKKKIDHLDGAVRVFSLDHYEEIYDVIAGGGDVDEHIGKRYKMFLILGDMKLDDSKDMLIEWFRYNPLIAEYFSGEKTEPVITHLQYDELYKDNTKISLT